MEFLMDPSIWVGLLTLVVLEIVLGIGPGQIHRMRLTHG